MNDKIIEALRTYFCNCPLLKEGKIGIDYLGENATEYSIDPMTCTPILKRYTDGGSLRQYQFAFMSTEIYSSEAIDNIENSGFYEVFAEWIEDQNDSGKLPEVSGIQTIESMSAGYLLSADESTARYQIPCRITYLKD